jgi:ribosome-associated protein
MTQFDNFHDDPQEEQVKSRTAIKKEVEALQVFGTQIVELSDKYLSRIPLEGRLAEAVQEARGMRHREGRRRQLQFIGKLMRDAENIEEIKEAYERVMSIGQENTKAQKQAELWRDRLLKGNNDSLQAFVDEFPNSDIQHLRQLIRNAQKELSQQKPPASARKLFRYIRELIEA